ncbi:MAG TPA: ScpA family protein [Chloroflexota bacterium]|nr:ScpA family protein [Chloroflexota bacterium]
MLVRRSRSLHPFPRICYDGNHGARQMISDSRPTVEIDGFSGPFDLLVRLVERRELDVVAISLAAVTEQYLEQLALVQLRDPEHLSAFLVVATKLLLIKSTVLLPVQTRAASNSDAELDPTDLTERLRIYGSFRKASQSLSVREAAGLRSYPSLPRSYRPASAPVPTRLDLAELQAAYLRAVSRKVAEPAPVPLNSEPRVTVAEMFAALETALSHGSRVVLGELIGAGAPRQRFVAAFLALLEAVRLGVVRASQESRFGEIALFRAAETDRPTVDLTPLDSEQ